jgi:cell division protein FtsI (penicillin-binding protein 3)
VACVLSKHPESLNDFHIKTSPGYFMLDGHKITDVTKRDDINLIDILLYSSNIGLTRLLQQYRDCDLKGCLKKFGFDSLSEIELLNEVSPYYPEKIKEGSFVEATLSFGYGLQINLAQLARAYTVLANHGVLKPMTLLKDNINQRAFSQVIDPHVADAIKDILQRVVEEGSGKKAYLKDYSIAGKTGTAQRVGLHGYEQRYHAFFAAIFPVKNPRYVLIIHADDPQGQIYGGQICAPLAKQVIPKLLAVSQIPTYSISH